MKIKYKKSTVAKIDNFLSQENEAKGLPKAISRLLYKSSVSSCRPGSGMLNLFPTQKKEQFLSLIKAGLSPLEASISLRLPINDVKKFIKDNINGIQQDMAKALIDRKLIHLIRISKAEKNWQASAFYLERRHPKEFGKDTKENTTQKKQVFIVNGKEVEF